MHYSQAGSQTKTHYWYNCNFELGGRKVSETASIYSHQRDNMVQQMMFFIRKKTRLNSNLNVNVSQPIWFASRPCLIQTTIEKHAGLDQVYL